MISDAELRGEQFDERREIITQLKEQLKISEHEFMVERKLHNEECQRHLITKRKLDKAVEQRNNCMGDYTLDRFEKIQKIRIELDKELNDLKDIK